MPQITRRSMQSQSGGREEPAQPPATIIETHTPDRVSRVAEDEPPVVEDDAGAGDGETREIEEPTDEEVEREAKEMGWKPDGPLTAAEFVQRGREVLPIVNESNRRLERQLAEERAKVEALQRDAAAFREFAMREARRELETEMQRLRDEHTRAISEGDGEAATRAAEALADAKAKAATSTAAPAATTQPPAAARPDPQFEEWKRRNPWYGTDERLTRRANAMAIVYRAEGKQGTDLFDAVEQELRDLSLIGDRARQRGDFADNGGRRSPSQRGKSYADLPLEAKRECDRFVSRGWIKDRAQYVRDYFSQPGMNQ